MGLRCPTPQGWLGFFRTDQAREEFNQLLCLVYMLRGWDKSPSLSIVFGLSNKTQWLSGLYYADFISFYSPTQLCGGGTTKSNSNEWPISVPLSFLFLKHLRLFINIRPVFKWLPYTRKNLRKRSEENRIKIETSFRWNRLQYLRGLSII